VEQNTATLLIHCFCHPWDSYSFSCHC